MSFPWDQAVAITPVNTNACCVYDIDPDSPVFDDELLPLEIHFESPSEQEDVADKDASFHFDEVQFLVEDTLFKVPRHHFEQNSKVLHDSFYTSATDKSVARQFTDDQAIHLDGISKSDFQSMLKAMFPESLWGRLELDLEEANDTQQAVEPLSWRDWASALKLSIQLDLKNLRKTAIQQLSECPTSIEDWTTVLRLATEWEVEETRETAICQLENVIDVVDKIELAIDCKVKDWLLKGYQKLVERDEVISPEEEGRLGWKATSRLFKLRHLVFQRRIGVQDTRGHICDKFSAELMAASYSSGSSKTEFAMARAILIDKEAVAWVESQHFSSVIFLVEETLFKIPWHYFKQNSEVFGNMPPLPPPGNRFIDGSRDSQPFRLDGVRKHDFRQLLRIIFRTDSALNWHQNQAMSWEDWTSIYKLSDMWLIGCLRVEAIAKITDLPSTSDEWIAVLRWSMEQRMFDIRAIAIQNLGHMIREVQKIELAREHKIPDWLVSGYFELVKRHEEISEMEEDRLGRQTTSKLLRIRDRYLHNRYMQNSYHYSHHYSQHRSYDPESTIRSDFEAELETAEFVP